MNRLIGSIQAVSAYIALGLVPALWDVICRQGASAGEILSLRFSTAGFMIVLAVIITPKIRQLREEITKVKWFLPSAILSVANYVIFIWAISQGLVFEASIGLLVGPLFHIPIERYWFRKSPSFNQYAALVPVVIGLLVLGSTGPYVWVSLALGGTWTLAQAFRKSGNLQPVTGFACEMVVALILVAPYMVFHHSGVVHYVATAPGLVILSGVATVLPFVLLTAANQRLSFASLGWWSYVAPGIQLLMAVTWFHEIIDFVQILGYVLIGAGAVVAALPWNLNRRAA